MITQVVNIAIIISAVLVSISAFFVLKLFFEQLVSKASGIEANMQSLLNENIKKRKQYGKMQKKLARLGIMYYLHNYQLSPGYYILIKGIVAILGGVLSVILFQFHVLYVVIGCVLGYYAPDFYFNLKNRSDNKEIDRDIYKVYITLNISLSSNIYIVDALLKAASNIENKRFKSELLFLSDALAKKEIRTEDAVDAFEERFDSPTIKSFSNLISTYFVYGQNEHYATDLMDTVVNTAKAQALRDQADIESQGQLYTFLFFADIIACIAYVAIMSFAGIQLF